MFSYFGLSWLEIALVQCKPLTQGYSPNSNSIPQHIFFRLLKGFRVKGFSCLTQLLRSSLITAVHQRNIFKYFYYGYLQFLDNVIINKTNVFLPQACVTIADLVITFRPFGFITPKTLNYLAFQSFYFECTRWRLFQTRIVLNKFYIYALKNDAITIFSETQYIYQRSKQLIAN